MFLSAAIVLPPALPSNAPAAEPPSLDEVLPAPALTRDRLHAAISIALREEPSVPLPNVKDGALAKVPVLVFGPFPPGGKSSVLLIESSDDPSAQEALRRLLAALPGDLTGSLYGPSFFSPGALGAFLDTGDAALRRSAADLLLKLGILSAPEHWLLTAARPVRLSGVEDPAAFRRFRRLSDQGARAGAFAMEYVETLEQSLEPVEQRAFGLELWALQRNRAAFEAEELDASAYIERLLDREVRLGEAVPGSTRQLKRLVDLSAFEVGLDFEEARRERDQLIERLHRRAGAREADLLSRRTADLAEGRVTPARHARFLFDQSERAGIPPKEFPAFFRFYRYAELAEELDLGALSAERRRLEEILFGPEKNTPAQADLARLVQNVHSLHRALENGLVPDNAPWTDWRELPERAETSAEDVNLTVPRPAFPWPQALAALDAASRSLKERAPAMADELIRRSESRPVVFLSPPDIRAPLQEALSAEGAKVTRLIPLTEETDELPPSALELARVWGLRRLAWSDGETSARAVTALWENLLLVLRTASNDEEEPSPKPNREFDRRFHLRVGAGNPRRWRGGGEIRVTVRGKSLPTVSLLWRWVPKDIEGKIRGFYALGNVEGLGSGRRLCFRPLPGLLGPWRWAQAQVRAVREATRRFFRMQMKATLLAGAWMIGGVVLSAFAGVVSAVLVAVWLAVGVIVLIGVVVFGSGGLERESWKDTWRSIQRKATAFRMKLLGRSNK